MYNINPVYILNEMKLRKAVYSGKLSRESIQKLIDSGMFPQLERYLEGVEKGTQNIFAKSGVKLFGTHKKAGDASCMTGYIKKGYRYPEEGIIGFLKPRSSVHPRIGKLIPKVATVPDVKRSAKGKIKGAHFDGVPGEYTTQNNSPWQIIATRRHEADEARFGRYNQQLYDYFLSFADKQPKIYKQYIIRFLKNAHSEALQEGKKSKAKKIAMDLVKLRKSEDPKFFKYMTDKYFDFAKYSAPSDIITPFTHNPGVLYHETQLHRNLHNAYGIETQRNGQNILSFGPRRPTLRPSDEQNMSRLTPRQEFRARKRAMDMMFDTSNPELFYDTVRNPEARYRINLNTLVRQGNS